METALPSQSVEELTKEKEIIAEGIKKADGRFAIAGIFSVLSFVAAITLSSYIFIITLVFLGILFHAIDAHAFYSKKMCIIEKSMASNVTSDEYEILSDVIKELDPMTANFYRGIIREIVSHQKELLRFQYEEILAACSKEREAQKIAAVIARMEETA